MNHNSLFLQTIFVSLNYCCWLEQYCTDRCYGLSVKFTEQPSNMQKHAFLCQRNCIYVYVTRRVRHGIQSNWKCCWYTCRYRGQCVGRYVTDSSLCVWCALYYVQFGVNIVFCGLILPVINFSLITGLYVGMSNIQISHLWSVTLMRSQYCCG